MKMKNKIYNRWLDVEAEYDFNINKRYIDEFGMIGIEMTFCSSYSNDLDAYNAYVSFCDEITSDENVLSEDFDAIDVVDGEESEQHGGGDWLYAVMTPEDGSYKKMDIKPGAFIIDVELSAEDMQDEYAYYMSEYGRGEKD